MPPRRGPLRSMEPVAFSRMSDVVRYEDADLRLARELFPQQDSYFQAYEYERIYRALGSVVWEEDFGDYQGDTLVLYEGFRTLTFGWGSCSGCDALQACSGHEDVAELIADLRRSIIDHKDLGGLVAWLRTQEAAGGVHYSADWTFIELKMLVALGVIVDGTVAETRPELEA